MKKERKKVISRKIAFFFLRSFVVINSVLPLGLSYAFGAFLGLLAFFTVARHRKIALESLAIAFPEKSIQERRALARDFFVYMAQGSFELLHYLRYPEKLSNVDISGEKILKEGLAKKKGVLLITAHFGNFALLSLKLAKAGYPVNFVTRPMRDEKAGEYLYKLRTNAGVKSIFSYPRRDCVMGIINALRNNEIVIMQMDQNFGTGGVWVKFFGHLAATPTGPVTLALRTQAAVIPAYIAMQPTGHRHTIFIEPHYEARVTSNKDETVLINVVNLSRIIESWIRKFPSHWSWIHRRWKSRPSEAILASQFKVQRD